MEYNIMCEEPVVLVNKAVLNAVCLGAKLNGRLQHIVAGKRPVDVSLNMLMKMYYDNPQLMDESYVQYDGYKDYLYVAVPCGKCVVCRENKRNSLVFRAAMESAVSSIPPVFFTLTYAPKYLPWRGNLAYRDVQLFFKRLRKRFAKKGLRTDFRYLVAGEYGSKRGRPHYHIIMWNNPYGASEYFPQKMMMLRNDIYNAWGMSEPQSFDFGQCRGGAASYAAKYVSKQVNELNMRGRSVKPFIHTSIARGGLGAKYLDDNKDYLRNNPAKRELAVKTAQGVLNVGYFSYVTKRIWPSLSRMVPARAMIMYREYVDICRNLTAMGVLTANDADMYCDMVRPAPNVVPNRYTVNDMSKIRTCSTYNKYISARMMSILNVLGNELAYYHEDISHKYIDEYMRYKSYTPASVKKDIASKIVDIKQKHAVELDKEIL